MISKISVLPFDYTPYLPARPSWRDNSRRGTLPQMVREVNYREWGTKSPDLRPSPPFIYAKIFFYDIHYEDKR